MHMKRSGSLSRRTLLVGLGTLGACVAVPWTERARAGDAAASQRAVLFEEDPADPNGRQLAGGVVWRAEPESAGGQDPATTEMVLRAKVTIPDRGMTLEWTMRRNPEKLIWSSHTIELVFDLPANFPHGAVQSVPGMLMKTNQNARGEPLIGTPIKVKSGYFVVGLSAVEAERRRNVMLLKDLAWLDIPIVYTDGRRAILAVEKGPAGARAFAAAFAAWEGGTRPGRDGR